MTDWVYTYWDVLKSHWDVVFASYLVIRVIEWFVRTILKKLFGVVAGPFKVIKKGLAKVSVFDWVLIALLIICFIIITYLMIALYS